MTFLSAPIQRPSRRELIRLAAIAGVDPDTILAALEGKPLKLRSLPRERAEMVLRSAGYLPIASPVSPLAMSCTPNIVA